MGLCRVLCREDRVERTSEETEVLLADRQLLNARELQGERRGKNQSHRTLL